MPLQGSFLECPVVAGLSFSQAKDHAARHDISRGLMQGNVLIGGFRGAPKYWRVAVTL